MARGALTLTAVVLACVACARSRRAEWHPRETNEATIPPPYRPRPPSPPPTPPAELRDPFVDYFVPRIAAAFARRAASGDAGVSVDASSEASAPTLATLRGLTPRASVQRCRRQHVEPREMPGPLLEWDHDAWLRDTVSMAATYARNDNGPFWGGPVTPTLICYSVAARFDVFLLDLDRHGALMERAPASVSPEEVALSRDGLIYGARRLRGILRRPNVEAAAGASPGWWCERLRAWILLLSEEPDALDHLRASVTSPLFCGDPWSLLLLADHDDQASASQRAEWYARAAADTELHASVRAYAFYRLAWRTRGPAAAEPLTRAVALLDVVEPGWFGRRVSAALARDACAIVRRAP